MLIYILLKKLQKTISPFTCDDCNNYHCRFHCHHSIPHITQQWCEWQEIIYVYAHIYIGTYYTCQVKGRNDRVTKSQCPPIVITIIMECMQEQYNNIISTYIIYWHVKHSFLAATGLAHRNGSAGTQRYLEYNYLQYSAHRTWFSNTFLLLLLLSAMRT